jgi:putative oligomerization/nucleic acid binding protein/phospholipase D-like protein
LLAADYPFLDVLWTMFIFFAWVIWFFLLFRVFGDIFRRHDLSGWGKVGWTVLVIILPFIGVFIYLLVNSQGIAERDTSQAQKAQSQMDDYIRTTAGGSAAEIEKAKQLLDSGAITQAEYDQIKAQALAAT